LLLVFLLQAILLEALPLEELPMESAQWVSGGEARDRFRERVAGSRAAAIWRTADRPAHRSIRVAPGAEDDL
jgi:hypothetical protein